MDPRVSLRDYIYNVYPYICIYVYVCIGETRERTEQCRGHSDRDILNEMVRGRSRDVGKERKLNYSTSIRSIYEYALFIKAREPRERARAIFNRPTARQQAVQ